MPVLKTDLELKIKKLGKKKLGKTGKTKKKNKQPDLIFDRYSSGFYCFFLFPFFFLASRRRPSLSLCLLVTVCVLV